MKNPFYRPSLKDTGLLIIDLQEKFKNAIPAFNDTIRSGSILARAFALFGLPVYITEQYPQGLGPTVPEILQVLPDKTIPFVKKSFSCCGAEGLTPALEKQKLSGLVVCGIETHVCVYQTVLDLLACGMDIVTVADAMASRKQTDHTIALHRMEIAGALLMTVEMVLFDLLRTADSPLFKQIQKLIK